METLLQPPRPFCFEKDLSNITTGNLSAQWRNWRKAFTIFQKACQLELKDQEVQISILLHVIGEQCREVYDQFSETVKLTTVEAVLDKFDAFFTPKKNITIERHKFFTRKQMEHETVAQYVFELNKMALQCEFRDLKDELIKDRLICGIREDLLRERLLRESDLSLKKALDICNIAEMSRAQASTVKLEQDSAMCVHELRERDDNCGDIHWVQRNNRMTYGWKSNQRGPTGNTGARGMNGSGDGVRGGVGAARVGGGAVSSTLAARYNNGFRRQQDDRLSNSPSAPHNNVRYGRVNISASVCAYCGLQHEKFACPAYGQRCVKCQKMNHYARVCRQVFTVQDLTSKQVCGKSIGVASDEWFADLQIGNNCIRFKLDTGADVNVLPYRFLSQTGITESNLIPTSMTLASYSGESLKVLGTCTTKVICKNQPHIVKFTIVDVNSPPVLGKETCAELNLVKRIYAITQIQDSHSGKILNEYPEVFEGMGCLPGEYTIKLHDDSRPVVHAPRKLPIALRDEVKQKLDEMLKLGVIAKVEGPTDWVNSMTVVKKPNGDIRICLDPRDLNKYIRREHFKLPTLDEITSKLNGSKYFSTLDCKQSFWQTKLNSQSTDLCTFNTVFGRYKFLRMPFGISSASEVFHKKLYECFDDIQGVELFVDDLLVHGKSQDEHDERLRQVLNRCKQINVKLNREKCKIGLTEIKYLGHIISQHGIKPDRSHILPILDMPKPLNAKDVERFLGLVTYVGNFIPNLSDRTSKLRELLKKETAWHWDETHETCFNELKQSITNPPVLQYISVDASKNGLGACLMQDNLPVCFASKSLTKTEQAYAQIEKELYACVFACEKFYAYIYGRSDITIETDHKPLISIIKRPIAGAPSRLQRMLIRLQPYAFKLVYKPGKYLYIADTLSRAVAPSSDVTTEPRDELDIQAQVCALALSNPLTDSHFQLLQRQTNQDDELQSLIKQIKDGWPANKKDLKNEVRQYWEGRDEMTVAYDLAWRGQKIIIPRCMRHEMLKNVHVGHLGAAKTKLRAREIMYWPNMNSQIDDMISNCQACLMHRRQNVKEPLISHEIPSRAWSKIGIDLFHYNGNAYLLVVDYFSKYTEVEQLQNLTSNTVINKLKTIFSRQGIPDIIISDNGPEFSSKNFSEFGNNYNFKHITTSPRYPQSNGQVERTIQTIKQMLRKTYYNKTDFRLALLEYLNTPLSETIPSPAELMLCRKLRSIVPCYPKLLEPNLINYKKVHDNLIQKQTNQKKYYDRGSKELKALLIGSKVKVSIDNRWVNGTVIDIIGSRSYVVKMSTGSIIRRNRRHIILDSGLRQEINRPTTNNYDDIQPQSTSSEHPPCSSPARHGTGTSAGAGAGSPGVPSNSSSPQSAAIATAPNTTTTTTSTYNVSSFGRILKPTNRWNYA